MSRKLLLYYAFLSLLAFGVAALPIATLAAPTRQTIPVQDADGVFEADTSVFPHEPQLPATYFPVRASDGTGWFNTVPISGTLRTLIEQIPDSYFPVRASDGTGWFNTVPISGTLRELIDEIPAYYFPVTAADGTFIGVFGYPVELLGDTFPPQISNASIDQITGLAEWETNEFATSTIWYGTNFGSYTHVVSSTLWAKSHRFILPGLTEDMQYFLVRGADRSGNLAEYYIPGYSISGNAQDSSGSPIANVVIWVSPTQVTLTDEDGNYTLQGIPAGDYVIMPCHPQYDFTPESITVTVSDDLAGQNFVGRAYTADFIATPTSGIAPLTVVFTNTSLGDYTDSLWDFGDGVSSTLDSPTHVYWTSGIYTVALTVSGPAGSDMLTHTNYITVYETTEADFTATPRSGIDSVTVAFTNLSGGAYTASLWDFGDGITSTQESPAHTYTQPGAYDVSLTVSGPGGTDTEERQDYITVYEHVVVDFTASPTSGPHPLSVAFSNTSTGDYTASLWDFGDGATSTARNPTHIYTLPDVYTVTLTVSGPGGTDTESRPDYITVYEQVRADFIASTTSGIDSVTVVFTNTSTGDYATSLWRFGDGATSMEEDPTHAYTQPGAYDVGLTVSGLGGTDTELRLNYIHVYESVVAGFTGSPTVGFTPLSVVFNNASTGDYTASLWDFGDGETSTASDPTHIYTLPDVYTVTLTASGPGGTDQLPRPSYITVYEPVSATFTASPRSGSPPLTVRFTDTSSGPVATWQWAFGDGQISILQHPTHIYTARGVYTVSLTVRAAGGSAAWPGGTSTRLRVGYITVPFRVYLPLSMRND